MNIDTGEVRHLNPAFEKMIEGMQQLPNHLSPFAEEHMAQHPGKPVDLSGDSKLAYYAKEQRAKRAANASGFGKCRNKPE